LLYTPDMKMKTQIIRSELEVHAWGDSISVWRSPGSISSTTEPLACNEFGPTEHP
jgi:hypothetical protein